MVADRFSDVNRDRVTLCRSRRTHMRRFFILASAVTLIASSAVAADTTNRTFDATYTATITNIPADAGVLDIWIPLPRARSAQGITDVKIDSPYQWQRFTEKEFGNEYAVAKIPAPQAGELVVKVSFRGTRSAIAMEKIAGVTPSKSEIARALRADRMVTLSPRVKKLSDEIVAGKTTTVDKALAIYEYVMTTMKYDKTTPGWGNGDTERACDIKAGNCSDFHSLFISLARSQKIPARFVIGFPLPQGDGRIPSYHCWAEFYVEGKGWIPVDASDASKSSDPAVRAMLFGNLPPNRVEFTMGRDLVLTPATSEPLNFFIYPRVETKGKPVGTASLSLEVRDVKGGTNIAAGGDVH
ncbi:MAG: transglutaminase [Acidobacteria bacterium]|nr:MAG: transglutaminase [Acidobacteriota bacterium]